MTTEQSPEQTPRHPPTGPQVREAIANIPAYVPGKPPAPRPGVTTYKLSSNENPNDPLPGVLEAAVEAAATMNRYPDMGTALYAALSERLGVPTTDLAAGTGSVAVLYHLLQAFCEAGDEVVYAWRSFEAYPIAVSVTGATSVQVPAHRRCAARPRRDGRRDRAHQGRHRVPPTPTGPSVGRAGLEAFLAKVPPRVLVVVDEAYREFVRSDARSTPSSSTGPTPTWSRCAPSPRPTAWPASRSATSSPGPSPGPCALALPFGVSSVAQAAAVASLAREAELLERVDGIVAERTRVVEALRGQGFEVPDAQGNFVWLALGDRTGEFAAAARRPVSWCGRSPARARGCRSGSPPATTYC